MSGFKLTDEQHEAVYTRGKPMLVNAAAGSGKTRVLTERLIARVREGESIDRFLVITFTRAAAAELKSRILTELNRLAAAEPSNARLRRQSALLYRAQIGTIDSFCAAAVRENAHLLGVSPGFSVMDEERGETMRARALEDVLDRAYERIGEDGGLRALVDSVGAGRDDTRLAELVLRLHDQLQSRVWPEKWAEEKLAALDVSGVTDAAGTVWGRYLLDDAAAEAAYRAEALEEAVTFMKELPDGKLFAGYGPSFSDAALYMRDIARACSDGWDRARLALDAPWPKLGRVMKYPDEAAKNRAKAVWDDSRDAVKKLQSDLAGSSAALMEGIRRSRPALKALTELVFALDAAYAERKRRADAFDFSDVEHMCVRLMCEEGADAPSAAARAYSARFAEVMVDEYQDVNEVQELIFRRVSGEGARLFMVGDVKQSIYRFRLAEPAIFNRKYEEFADGVTGRRVSLRQNFRSRKPVLDACNAVFSRIMSKELGQIEYDGDARLAFGAQGYDPAGDVKPELVIIDPVSADEEETPDKTLAEARYVAARIRDMVASGLTVTDGDGPRPVEYRDIAVLLRAPGTSGAAFRRALTEAGVPVSARQGGAFFSRPEVSFCLSMLSAADNPRQDVPLIAAMRGLPFGFTPDELTAVRAACPGDLWDAVRLRAAEDEKCARFVSVLTELRDIAREEPTERVLRWLYDRTGLMAACAAAPDGMQRAQELMQLYEYARRFESDGNRGLFRFTAWLQALEERGMEPPVPAAGGSVQLMSIHKSKGLEFPVVFLADNSRRWARSGTEQVLCDTELGLGMRVTDTARGIDYPTLPWRAIRRKTKLEELSEQERVLYVAMTRAKERLIMTCVQPKAEEKLAALGAGDGPISPRVLAAATGTAGWLMRAAAADAGRTMTLSIAGAPEAEALLSTPEQTQPEPDEEAVEALAERLSWRYPYAAAAELPSKLTATGIARIAEPDPEALPMETRERAHRRFRAPEPGRGTGEKPLTGAERGIAAHLVMQYIDFDKTDSAAGIAGEIERLRTMGFLDGRQAASVPPEDILAFFRSDIGRRLRAADRVVREFRFSLLCPASMWYPEAPAGEEILLQGVVDCCIEEAGQLTVIDFKTDARMEPSRYEGQLAAYAHAMGRILKKPVRGAVLWYLRHNQAAEIALDK